MKTIKKFFQSIQDSFYIGKLNDGNRRDRRKAKRLASKH